MEELPRRAAATADVTAAELGGDGGLMAEAGHGGECGQPDGRRDSGQNAGQFDAGERFVENGPGSRPPGVCRGGTRPRADAQRAGVRGAGAGCLPPGEISHGTAASFRRISDDASMTPPGPDWLTRCVIEVVS